MVVFHTAVSVIKGESATALLEDFLLKEHKS